MNKPFRLSAQVVFGSSIILLGVLFTLDNLEVIDARYYLRFWPAMLVLVGLVQLIQPKGSPGKVMGSILFTIGSLMLLDRLDFVDFEFWDLWPVFIILFGLSLVRGARFHRGAWGAGASHSEADSYVRGFAIMGGYARQNNSQEFRGGELTAVMGGCELDLRRASMTEGEATIEIFAFWGGIEIKVPEDWNVAVKVMPIMGGVEDKSVPPRNGSKKLLTITGYTIMGGAEIKN